MQTDHIPHLFSYIYSFWVDCLQVSKDASAEQKVIAERLFDVLNSQFEKFQETGV